MATPKVFENAFLAHIWLGSLAHSADVRRKIRGSHNNASAWVQRDVNDTLVGFLAKETIGGLESKYGSSTSNPGALSYISFPKISIWFWLKVSAVLDALWLIHPQMTRISLFQVVLLPVLQESYPSTPPIWFVDSDDPSLAEVLERLEDVRKGSTLVSRLMGPRLVAPACWARRLICRTAAWFFSWFLLSNQLLQQLKRLICDLCRLYNLPQHPDVEMLDQPLPTGPITQDRKVPGEEKALCVEWQLGIHQLTVCYSTTARAVRWGDVWGRGGGRNGRGICDRWPDGSGGFASCF